MLQYKQQTNYHAEIFILNFIIIGAKTYGACKGLDMVDSAAF